MLAEHDLLRHIEVLSCVSGGSIVGACYWMALRNRLMQPEAMDRDAYVALLKELIDHFKSAVDANLRGETQPGKLQAFWRLLNDSQGLLEPEDVAKILNRWFYQPLMAGRKDAPIFLDDLPFTPADHDPALAGPGDFNPGKHNWLRQHKVPALVLNATSVNTGHAWQFTTTWMGESPWSVHEATDSVARLEWAWYSDDASWRMELGRAVAASACVPGVFNPLKIDGKYADEVLVQLVDGGVHDNQGTVSLLAMDCNILLVSDACGQLLFQKAPQPGLKGLASYVMRSMDVLMERVRNANFADLQARKQSGQLRALMFLHMKAGLEPEVVPRLTSQQPHTVRRGPIAPSGLRRDFQRALAELRTDLNRFTDDEANALMACGYQMAKHAVQRDLSQHSQLAQPARAAVWPFEEIRKEIASTAETTARRAELLEAFEEGKRVRM